MAKLQAAASQAGWVTLPAPSAQIMPIIQRVCDIYIFVCLALLTSDTGWTVYMTRIAKIIAKNQITNGGPSESRRYTLNLRKAKVA